MRVGIIGAAVMAAITVAPRASASECIVSGVGVWPPSGSTIPTNGIIIVRGMGGRSRYLAAYIDEHRPALACGKRVIPLRMKDLFVGVGDNEALLVPARPLPPQTRCELVLAPRSDRFSGPITWIDAFPFRGYEAPLNPPWWTTAAAADRRPPAWEGAPRWSGVPARGGYPGEASVQVAVGAADAQGPVLVRVVLDDGREKNDFLLAADGGTIELGYDACGGAFALEPDQEYRISLSAIDAAGHETRAPAQLPPFTAP